MKKTTVVVVDDSALIRSMLTKILSSDASIEVLGAACDAYEARDMIKALQPDVITLDIEMPKMDGISFLKNIMRLRPMPVVMISTLTQNGAPATLQALEMGAVDYVAKPKTNGDIGLTQYSQEIIEKVKVAATAKIRPLENLSAKRMPPGNGYPVKHPAYKLRLGHVIAIGASTGGTEAIKDLLMRMPAKCPPIIITQHIPPSFSRSYAQRLNRNCPMTVIEAKTGDILRQGCAYLAPGSHHLLLKPVSDGSGFMCVLSDGDLVNRHRPAVEVMFDSALRQLSAKSLSAVILTGMGSDGAQAMKRLRDAGVYTVAQDEESSVVWGMPGAAVKLDAAVDVLPLDKIAVKLMRSASR